MSFTHHVEGDYVEATFDSITLTDETDVQAWGDCVRRELERFRWPVDLLVNLDSLRVKAKAVAPYGQLRNDILRKYSHRSTRYGGDSWIRTTISTGGVLYGADTNLFDTRGDALSALLEARREKSARRGTKSPVKRGS